MHCDTCQQQRAIKRDSLIDHIPSKKRFFEDPLDKDCMTLQKAKAEEADSLLRYFYCR